MAVANQIVEFVIVFIVQRELGSRIGDFIACNVATATVTTDVDALAAFPGAQLVVRAEIAQTFPNCARYVHKHERVDTSKYVPDERGEQPTASWKKIDMIQPFLAPADQQRVANEGETITGEEYAERLGQGTS